MHERAGLAATPEDLIDVAAVIAAYHEARPDLSNPAQRVAFGTSGHRGTSLNASFTEAHIAAISLAIAEYRAGQGITGPLFIGADSHPLSAPALATAVEVLLAAGVEVRASAGDALVPTPALSHAILSHNEAMHAAADRAAAGTPADGLADGIVVTPSHNPPQDGGFKYNPPHGGPADTDATDWIAARANELLEQGADIARAVGAEPARHDFMGPYVAALGETVNVEAIREAGVRIGAHPLGGAAVEYWAEIARVHKLDLTVLGPGIDPTWSFMTLDWDGKIRMDPSSPHAMAGALAEREHYDLLVANDADADRFGVITRGAGLQQPNHVLAVAIDYLLAHRAGAGSAEGSAWKHAAIGKTLVSSAIIDRVVAGHGRELLEVPVGFKWFVPGLHEGSVAFGGEESAGASFLRTDGRPWSTDKDGIIMCLLAAEITAVTGESIDERYRALTREHGTPVYRRVDAAATPDEKARLKKLTAADITAGEFVGEAITAVLTEAPGNGAAIGGLKVMTENAWFAARPSGTEDVYKVYAESFLGEQHLEQVLAEAQALVARALA
ncbi:alpha-D-glucose phosphate-specific phosphoglucomutase [Leucobacter sp. UCMA 4100]|uniref:phosphoglucomutase n=1 Tax=Leucobacter sp. UCMA 4100 TaxID=2810534 RepID=UPI0022EB0BF2|nr:phosphoglucomutase [Leucobacter sp. UCMA 4100]MDA3146580.1 alpha-D-glucose phosphate-specific phosphoglucomutase [Leucobacter sp. UCMA 4100]